MLSTRQIMQEISEEVNSSVEVENNIEEDSYQQSQLSIFNLNP